MYEVELWVFIDERGEYGVGNDQEAASQDYQENVGEVPVVGLAIRVKLLVPTPKPAELTGSVPPEREGEVRLTSAE